MKKRYTVIYKLINKKLIMKNLLLFLFLLPAVCVLAQWEPDVRLAMTQGEQSFGGDNAHRIASNGDTLYVIWLADTNYNGWNELYYRRSTNGGLNWGPVVQLVPDNSYHPYGCGIAVSGISVHVIWIDNQYGKLQMYYRHSTDAGLTWSTDVQLTDNTSVPDGPCIDVFGSTIHIVWQEQRDGKHEIYYKRSADAGLTWGPDTRLSDTSAIAISPFIAVSGTNVHVVWSDSRDGTYNYEVYYKHSADGGLSWGADTRLTNDLAYSGYPHISAFDSDVSVVWCDGRDNNYFEIYYKRSADAGLNWDEDIRLTNDPDFSGPPSVAVSGLAIHVVWTDGRSGNNEIYYKRSIDGGVNWEEDMRLTNAVPFIKYSPAVLASNDAVHVVWADTRDAVGAKIYYKRNPTGNSATTEVPVYQRPLQFKLEQNFPNPFAITTKISYQMQMEGYVRIKVYDLFGNEVATLVNEEKPAGSYSVNWIAANLKSGIYFYSLKTGALSVTKKMVLINP
jgi:hypothetical protein